ncbi:uncharacterized protein TNCV_2934371 [Trichonephila clavipes]|nr:uncharacterized protein TNCV_2934371 [Trichonephila clavipes]
MVFDSFYLRRSMVSLDTIGYLERGKWRSIDYNDVVSEDRAALISRGALGPDKQDTCPEERENLNLKREPEQEARDYDQVSSLLLKRFKLTPEKFRKLFVTHQKSSDKTWRDFYQEVQTFFNGWIEGLDAKTFDKLRDLMIADQMKKRAPVEFKERHLDEWPCIISLVELAERLEEFEDVRRTLEQKTHTLTPVRRPEVRDRIKRNISENLITPIQGEQEISILKEDV